MNLALIPARGGSKRVPRKNIRDFCGRPMIGWAIEAARESGCFARVLVSTDDAEIAAVARGCGAEVPFLRPAGLADDHAGTAPVVAHALRWCAEQGIEVEHACCLYATAAFVEPGDLREGLRLLQEQARDFVLAVTAYAAPIQRALRIRAGVLEMFDPARFGARSQDLEPAYHDAGQFCWGRRQAWLEQLPLQGGRNAALALPRHRVQDIDTPEDWLRAEAMFRALRVQGGTNQEASA